MTSTLGRRVRNVALAGLLVAAASGCAGGPRPVLVPSNLESAVEIAQALPAAPLDVDLAGVSQQTTVHPTEADAFVEWANDSGIVFAGVCLIAEDPPEGAVCGIERTPGIWILGEGSNRPWYVVEINNAAAGSQITAVHLAGS